MYELYIQDTNGTFRLADLGTDLPAINIQRNDIGELKDRQTDYSQAVKLPKTPTNVKIFSFLDEFSTYFPTNTATTTLDLRHKYIPCRLYAEGYAIVGNGAYLKFVSITDTAFTVQIVGALASFFTTLKDLNKDATNPVQKTLNDLNFTEVINRGYAGFLQSEPANYPDRHSFFAIADFFSEPSSKDNGSFNKDLKTISEWMQYPFVKFKSIIDKILTDNGITKLESDITSDLEYTNSCIPFDSLKPDVNAMNGGYIMANNLPLNIYYDGWDQYVFIAIDSGDQGEGFLNTRTGYFGKGSAGNYTCSFRVPTDGIYLFNIKVNATKTDHSFFGVNYRYDDGTVTLIQGAQHSDTTFSCSQLITLSVTNTEYIYFTVEVNGYSDYIAGDCSLSLFSITCQSIKISKDSKAAIGIDMPIKGNLPDITQEDFFKSFLQLFGLTVDIDVDSNTMRAYTLNQVIKNKANAPDWSREYSKGSGTVKFTLGSYAQTNQIEYKEFDNSIATDSAYTEVSEGLAEYMHNNRFVIYYTNTTGGDTTQLNPSDTFVRDQLEYYVVGIALDDDDLKIKSKGYIYMHDNTLDKTAYTLFEPIFKAAENNTVLYGSTNRYRYAKLKRISKDQTFSTGDTPTLLLFRYTAPVTIRNENSSDMGTPNLYFVSSVSPAIGTTPEIDIEAQHFIDKYYPGLTNNVLSDVRLIEDAEFYLTPKDICEYDPFTPVYIDTFGAYFYVNKIKNFVSGKLTKVDLVRI